MVAMTLVLHIAKPSTVTQELKRHFYPMQNGENIFAYWKCYTSTRSGIHVVSSLIEIASSQFTHISFFSGIYTHMLLNWTWASLHMYRGLLHHTMSFMWAWTIEQPAKGYGRRRTETIKTSIRKEHGLEHNRYRIISPSLCEPVLFWTIVVDVLQWEHSSY